MSTTLTEQGTASDVGAAGGAMPAVYAVVRIAAGLLFMEHGAQKLFGWLGGMGQPGATAELFSMMGLAGVLEFFGGLLIVLGLLTRPVAVVLVLEMLAAYAMGHMRQALFPVQNGGELALLYASIFALFAATGAGPASVDGALARRKRI
ncbi:MAG TPA: DoxX family protein [Longimicrobiales bacterium]